MSLGSVSNQVQQPVDPGWLQEVTPSDLNQIVTLLNSAITVERSAGPVGEFPQDSGGIPVLESPTSSADDVALMLFDLNAKVKDTQLRASQENVKATQDKQKAAHDENLKKLMEFAEKMKGANKSGTAGKVFGWIAAVCMLIAAAFLMLVNPVAGAMMMAAAVMTITMLVDGETGGKMMEGIGKMFSKLFMAFGMEPEKAKFAGEIAAMVMVTGIVIALSAGGAAGGAAASTGNITQMAVSAAIKTANSLVSAAAQVGQGASKVGTAAYQHQASQTEADRKEIQAFLTRLNASMEEETERIKEIVQQIEEGLDTVMSIINSADETRSQLQRAV